MQRRCAMPTPAIGRSTGFDPDGYRLAGTQEAKPAPEELDELLSGAATAGLRSVDRFMRELSG